MTAVANDFGHFYHNHFGGAFFDKQTKSSKYIENFNTATWKIYHPVECKAIIAYNMAHIRYIELRTVGQKWAMKRLFRSAVVPKLYRRSWSA